MSRARCPAPRCPSWVLRLQGHACQIGAGAGRHSSLRMQAGGVPSPPLGRVDVAVHHGQAAQAVEDLRVALHQLPASVAVEEVDLLAEDTDLLVEDTDVLTLAPAGRGPEVPAAAAARRWRPRAWTAAEAGAQQGWDRGLTPGAGGPGPGPGATLRPSWRQQSCSRRGGPAAAGAVRTPRGACWLRMSGLVEGDPRWDISKGLVSWRVAERAGGPCRWAGRRPGVSRGVRWRGGVSLNSRMPWRPFRETPPRAT